MKQTTKLLCLGTAALVLAQLASAQIILPANSTVSGRYQWAPGNGPTHLGSTGTYWSAGDGNNFDDAGNLIVGDGGGANQNFGIGLAFDTSEAFRTAVANGNTVTLEGSTLFGVDDGFGGTIQKTVGNVDWSKILVTFQSYGNSVSGSISNADGFALARTGNLNSSDALTNATYAYAVGPEMTFSGDPYAADATFSIDITSLVNSIPLSSSNDRFFLGIFAYSDNGLAPLTLTNGNGSLDRIAFKSSSIQVAVPEPSTYALIFGALALGFMVWRRCRQS